MDFTFGFTNASSIGFNSNNSYSATHNIGIGDTTISTLMVFEPKYFSILDSTKTDITASLVIQTVLNGSTYDIVISSGTALNNVIVSAHS